MTFSELFTSYPLLLVIFSGIFGLLVGSFLNVVIYRLPIMMEREWTSQCNELLNTNNDSPQKEFATFNLAKPNSHCPSCHHAISAFENIPVISYLLQGGKCKHCKVSISARYPIIESITAILTCVVASKFGFTWFTLSVFILVWGLIVLTMIDFDHQLLPDDITLPLLWLGIVINALGVGLVSLDQSIWGAVAGYGILWGVYWLFKLLTGKEGMGFGDFKLLAALGAWLGWQSLPQIILLSSLVGAVVGISLIAIKGRDKNIPIPFGPYLAAAGFISLIWGPEINNIYLIWMQ